MRHFFALSALVVLATTLGCCGPASFGPGCAAMNGGCYDCEGGFGPRQAACNPIDALRNAKRSLVCGGGCGEVYYGEWISTPPHCSDPCCGTEYTGGASHCTPYCWPTGALRPINLITGLYGKRFCDSCGGDVGCDSCGGEGYYDDSSVIESAPSAGCSSCAARATAPGSRGVVATRTARQPVLNQPARTAARTAIRTSTSVPASTRMR